MKKKRMHAGVLIIHSPLGAIFKAHLVGVNWKRVFFEKRFDKQSAVQHP
jgi:hypothetical protein